MLSIPRAVFHGSSDRNKNKFVRALKADSGALIQIFPIKLNYSLNLGTHIAQVMVINQDEKLQK